MRTSMLPLTHIYTQQLMLIKPEISFQFIFIKRDKNKTSTLIIDKNKKRKEKRKKTWRHTNFDSFSLKNLQI